MPKNKVEPEFVGIAKAAAILDVTPLTLRRMDRQRRGPPCHRPKDSPHIRRYDVNELRAYIRGEERETA